MMVQGPDLGRLGLIPDQPPQKIPLGGWESARNVRFDGGYVRRIKEPTQLLATIEDGEWLQLYEDTNGPRQVYASSGKLYRRTLDGLSWQDVTNIARVSYADGEWQSFQYGTSVVFNNGVEPPQILYANANSFVDLPNWGLVGGAQGQVTCKALRLFGVYMVAMDLTIDGVRSQNGVWTSGPAIIDNVSQDSEMPSWDYTDPGSLSVLNYIGVEYGAIVDGLSLNNNFIVYTRESAHVLQLTGGQAVFSNRKAIPYGLVSLGAAAAFNNLHFCIGPSAIFVHDGSTVREIADQKINREFYTNLSNLGNMRCTENQEFKEVHTLFDSIEGRGYLIYNYEDDNFSFGEAVVEGVPVVCMSYGLAPPGNVETYNTITTTYAQETRTYAQMGSDGQERKMFWLTANDLHVAESVNTSDSTKSYFMTRDGWDFSEMAPSMTTDLQKSLETVIPHINGSAPTQITVTSAENLRSSTVSQEVVQYDPTTDYKADFRITGRWMGIRIEITGDGSWEMSSMDFDVKAVYGR